MFLGCNHLVLSLRWRPALSSLSSHRHMFWCLPLWFNCCRLLCLFWGCRWQPAPLFYELWYFFHFLIFTVVVSFVCSCLWLFEIMFHFVTLILCLQACCRIHPKTLANPFLDVITSIFFVFNLWDECSFLRRFDARRCPWCHWTLPIFAASFLVFLTFFVSDALFDLLAHFLNLLFVFFLDVPSFFDECQDLVVFFSNLVIFVFRPQYVSFVRRLFCCCYFTFLSKVLSVLFFSALLNAIAATASVFASPSVSFIAAAASSSTELCAAAAFASAPPSACFMAAAVYGCCCLFFTRLVSGHCGFSFLLDSPFEFTITLFEPGSLHLDVGSIKNSQTKNSSHFSGLCACPDARRNRDAFSDGSAAPTVLFHFLFVAVLICVASISLLQHHTSRVHLPRMHLSTKHVAPNLS